MGHHAKDYPSSPRRRRRWKPFGAGYISTETVQADKDLDVDHEIPEDLDNKYEGAIDSEIRRGEHARIIVSPDTPHTEPTSIQTPYAPEDQDERIPPPPVEQAPVQQQSIIADESIAVPTPPGDHHPIVKQARQQRQPLSVSTGTEAGRINLSPRLVSGILLVLAVVGVLGIALLLSLFVAG